MTGFAEDGRRIDHVAEARKHIDWAHEQQEREGDMGNVVRDDALLAQAEATLALVEQQRTANLIAWTVGSGYTPSPEVAAEIIAALHMPPSAPGAF